MPTNTPARQRDMAPATVAQIDMIKHKLNEYKPVVKRLLAKSATDQDTFVAWIANACRASPALWGCDPETVLGAALRCAQIDLAPNDGNNHAWIIPYGSKAQFQLGYGGVLELARRAVPGLRFDGRPVYPGDLFALDYGKQPPLKHTPYYARRPARDAGGEPFMWYVRALFPDGTQQVHALDRKGVEYHHAFSKMKDGDLWTKSYDAAALKSVVLDMRRWLPQTAQLATAIAADGAVIDVRSMDAEVPQIATATEAIGAGTVDDTDIAEPEPDPDDPDAQWVNDAKGATP